MSLVTLLILHNATDHRAAAIDIGFGTCETRGPEEHAIQQFKQTDSPPAKLIS